MATVKKACEGCGLDYEGHHKSKRCDVCKIASLEKIEPESIGSDIVVLEDCSSTLWHAYGMCDAGYEVFPGWVWSQRKLVCVRGDAPSEVLDMLQDAFQRKCVNRVPVMGDADYGVGK